MGRTLFTVAAGAVLVLLTACGAKPTADPPATTTSAPTTATSPTPPVMPALAKQHTNAGAEAFVQYVWKIVDYSMATLTSDQLSRLMSSECHGCQQGIEFINRVRAAGGSIEGGKDTISNVEIATRATPSMTAIRVQFTVSNTKQVVRRPGQRMKTYPPSTAHLVWMLDPEPTGWIVSDWRTAP